MNKLPEVLILEILSFLYKPSDCVIKGYDKFLIVDRLTYNESKKIRNKCEIENILDRKICKIHCKAYPLYKQINIEFNRQKYLPYIHFKKKFLARIAYKLFPGKFSGTCCSGKGLRQRKKNLKQNLKRKRINYEVGKFE